jgi:hypothetical protein
MFLTYLAGATSVLVDVFIQDSTSATGGGLTGLTNGTAGLTCYYHRSNAAAATVVNLTTMTAGTWATSGFIQIDATNMPGWYQFGVPNAALAAAATEVNFLFKGATNMVATPLKIRLAAINPDVATNMGITSLPTTAVSTNGSLITAGAGTNQITLTSGLVKLIPGQSWVASTNTAQTGSATTFTLAAGDSAVDQFYTNSFITITTGTGLGQTRLITNYVGSTKVATVNQPWLTLPNNTSVYNIIGSYSPTVSTSGYLTLGSYATGQDPVTLLTTNFNTVNTNINNVSGNVWNNSTRSLTDKSNFNLVQTFPTNFSSLSIDSLGRVTPSGSVTVAGNVTVGTNLDKTGYSLTQAFPSNFASLAIDSLGRVTPSGSVTVGTNLDKTGYVLTQTFPSNFATLAIDASGNVSLSNSQLSVDTAGTTTLLGRVTATRAGYFDNLTNLDTTVSSRSTYGGADTAGTTTLLGRLTSTRAGYLDNLTNLDTTISSVSGNVWLNGTRSLTDKSNFNLAQAFPTNFSLLAIDSLGRVTPSGSVSVAGNVTIGGYSAGQDPATLLASNFSTVNTNVNNVSGNVWLNATRTISDKTGFSLSQAFPANFSVLSIDSLGRVTPSGSVTIAGNVTVGAYASGQDPATLLASNFSTINTSVNNVSGNVWLNATRSLTDKNNFVLSTAEHTNIQTDVASGIYGQGYTATRAGKLDNLDATISSRSTYAGGDTSGVATLLTRVGSAILFDSNGYVKSDAIVANVTGNVTVGGYAGGQDPLSLLTTDSIKWAGKNIDTLISSRLAASGYTAPLNSSITAIKTQTDKLTFDGSNYILSDPQAQISATIAASSITAIANAVLTSVVTNPTGAPIAPYTIDDILGFLLSTIKFKRTQTSTTETLYQDDSTTILSTATVSDDGTTFTKSEFS